MKSNIIKNKMYLLALVVCLLSVISGCKKWYGLPADTDYLSLNVNYNITTYSPILGRTTLFSGIFNSDNSTLPISFVIQNVRNSDNSPSNSFNTILPVKVWTGAYDGTETSIAQIEAKRKLENHPLFEVRSSGEFICWSSADNTNLLKAGKDTSYLFDVNISNGGGQKLIKNLKLIPLREIPYSPSYQINTNTGNPLYEANGKPKRLLPNTLSGMTGVNTKRTLVREINGGTVNVVQDVYVYFNRVGNGNSLTFKFMDKDSLPINPAKFNGTNFGQLVHGFNMQMTSQYVKYDVAYPIPLIKLPTKYTQPITGTNDGSAATAVFTYNRIGFGGNREIGTMGLNFNIYKQGDWEIIFYFHNDTPKFDNE